MIDESADDTLVLRGRIVSSESVLRPTVAQVDLDAIARNLQRIRGIVGSAEVLAIVKADAYGHGVFPVARRLEQEGALGFGVALAEEAIELRDAGIRSKVVALNGVYGDAHAEVVARGITPVVYHPVDLESFQRAARGGRVGIHVKIDTGMTRLGVPLREFDAFLDALDRSPSLVVEGAMTHLASADVDPEFTREQLARFDGALGRLRARGHRPSLIHAGNSAATLRHPDARHSLVRPGIALYGHPGAEGTGVELELAMRLRSAIIAVRTIAAGETVGYCGTFRAARESRIATIPIGYADGYFRAFSNRADVLVRERRCPVVGNVSMDLTAIDVTELPSVEVGDEVVLLGRQGGAVIGLDELAAHAGTIPYEILTNVSRRVPRVYLGAL